MRTSLLLPLLMVALGAGCERRREDAAPQGRLPLETCRLPGVSAQARCGFLEVFEDRKARSGRKLKLHVAVVPALAAQPRPDPVFILAGGPGQAASEVASALVPALDRVRRTRDLVFVDQRGTGRSGALDCAFASPDAGLAEQLRPSFDDADVRRCVQTLSADHDLRLYGTDLAVEDLDEVRDALGYEKVNLWGASYGTRVGLVYMRRFPQRVRTAILDGLAPLELVLPADMAQDADRALQLLVAHCEKDEACRAAYPKLRERFDALLASLDASPANVTVPDPISGHATQVTISREAFVRTLRALLYQTEVTMLVPLTIERASEGDFRPFIAQTDLISGGFAKGLSVGMFFSVVCTEDVPFLDPAAVRDAGAGTFVGAGFADDIFETCRLWPKGTVEPSFREPVRSELPVLLFSGTLDPVTPPRWGEVAHRNLPNSLHLEVPDTGHGTLGNACVRRLIETFLEAGSIQGLDPRCDEGTRLPFFTNFAGPPP